MITKKFQHTTYSIELEITTSGVIDKTDIIGSLYNQLRDVLKEKVSFEDLVKSGNIGNIEISISRLKTRTKASCSIPTNLDFKQACLLAAKCEQITKIGHVQGSVKVTSIEHSQKDVEEKILKRAEELEKKFAILDEKANNSNNNKTESKHSIIEIAPNVYSSKSIKKFKTLYLVEGRSDVKNLIKHNILNVISVNGSYLDILSLKNEKWFSSKKLITLFDGDLSAKKLSEQIKEHLTISKEIYAPKNIEISSLTESGIKSILQSKIQSKRQTENQSQQQLKKENTVVKNSKIDDENYEIETNTSSEFEVPKEKKHFSKNEFSIIENYLSAIKDEGRIVGFDFTFGVVFDEPISKLSSLDFSLIEYILYDGLCENIFSKKIKDSPVKCIIAKGFSSKIISAECITFEEFETSVVE